ncbi:lysine transporter LysE [Sphaerisporangium rufum]|uniref:Lysine transporter LysE n=1 Tax=Sphaerisporangium rufum TaxID=1381558 RepID=A0A919R6J6_9ACTN|nr:LysE family translocator [Sphaerisporangium rufum]GII80559.1 lysine transporter LysE [Sphaerisporangium rufum]
MRELAVLGFLAAVAPITATPGTSLALVVSRVTAGGRRQGWWVILGTVTGLYTHAVLAAAGLAALVLHSSQAFLAVKLAGAAYLAGLGLWLLRPATRRPAPGRTSPPEAPPRRRLWRAHHPYLQGLLGNVLNPKAASIYLTLAPQFLQPGRPVLVPMLLLATAHAALHTCWLAGWTAASGAAAGRLRSAAVRRRIDRLAGAVLVAVGVRTALT